MPAEPNNKQLHLTFSHTENSLRQYLEEGLGKPTALILTKNSTSMLSARMRAGIMGIRLHRMFLSAGREILDEIVSFLKSKRGKMTHFHKFVRSNRELLKERPSRKLILKTAGTFHDLRELYEEVNHRYFGGTIRASITWGSRSPRCPVRKRTLGSYSATWNVIRINAVLDRKTVPRYYVSFVIYHEMLHAAIGISEKGGRRSLHPREFRRREKMFGDYEKAAEWERVKM